MPFNKKGTKWCIVALRIECILSGPCSIMQKRKVKNHPRVKSVLYSAMVNSQHVTQTTQFSDDINYGHLISQISMDHSLPAFPYL